MSQAIQRPDFEKFQVRPAQRRRAISRAFLVVCVITSSVSILVLALLLGTILIAALPVAGPYADRAQGEARFSIVQGTEPGNDPARWDAGDVIQGLVLVQRLERGGRGAANDVVYAADDEEPAASGAAQPERRREQWQVALMALEIESMVDENVARLRPATGAQNVVHILDRLGLDTAGMDPESTGIVIVTADDPQLALDDFQYDRWWPAPDVTKGATGSNPVTDRAARRPVEASGDEASPAIAGRDRSSGTPWSIDAVIGPLAATDFAELKLRQLDAGQAGRLRRRQELGRLKLLWSVDPRDDWAGIRFHPVRLRPFSTDEILTGDFKVDDVALEGLRRRDRRGFALGGDFEWTVCPVPEQDAGPLDHAIEFLKQPPRTSPDEAGIGPSLIGSVWVVVGCALFALPLGIGTAVFLEEFQPKARWLRSLHGLLQLNIANLAGVPSIVYGILGLTAFATMFGWFGDAKNPVYEYGARHYYQYLTEGMLPILVPVEDPSRPPSLVDGMSAYTSDMTPVTISVIGPDDEFPVDDEALKYTLLSDAEGGLISKKPWYYFQLPLGRGVLAASLTLMLVILPVIIISSQEALRAVPASLKEGALGLGATHWQVVRMVTLPAALPSIMTGAILSMSRAIGEAAPILILCGIVYITSGPAHLMDAYSVLPIQIYYWAGLPVDEESLINYQNVAAAGIVVLLAILLTFNGIAIFIRQWTRKPLT